MKNVHFFSILLLMLACFVPQAARAESYGIKARKDCRLPDGEMNVQKDILFYKDPVDFVITAQPGEDVTFAPETAHAPCIGEGTLRKAIFKVRVL